MIFLLRWYLAINLAGFLLAAGDKFAAKLESAQRVPESTLLVLAGLGAFPGESLAFSLFRHKTRKQSFRHAYVFATFSHFALFLFVNLTGLIHYLL
jgi:uncharacterized membrane protein YsdA (DUF1294 family)